MMPGAMIVAVGVLMRLLMRRPCFGATAARPTGTALFVAVVMVMGWVM